MMPSLPFRPPSLSSIFSYGPHKPRQSPTSYLDGLRGIAALQVYLFHLWPRYTPYGHTYNSTPEDKYIHQLPIFRPIWAAGSSAVSVFFVISGFVLTVRSFELLRQGDRVRFYDGLASSLFRRGFRLFLPVLALGVLTFVYIRLIGIKDGTFSWYRTPTTMEQIVHFLNVTDNHVNPFSYKDTIGANWYPYVPTSWTIPMEYYGSVVVYLLMVMLGRVEVFKIRFGMIVLVGTYALHRGAWVVSNFIFGMGMADWMLEMKTRTDTSMDNQRFWTIIWWLLLLWAIYLSGAPAKQIAFDFDPAPKVGYEWLYNLYPPYWMFKIDEDVRWFWYWSGNLTVLSISRLSVLQTLCNSRFCQWLGKLSFSYYLVHAFFIATVAVSLDEWTKTWTESKLLAGIIAFSAVTLFSTISAGLMERWIDVPSVQFAKWLEGLVFEKNQDSSELYLASLNRPLLPDDTLRQENRAID